jgi:hypothetical protein
VFSKYNDPSKKPNKSKKAVNPSGSTQNIPNSNPNVKQPRNKLANQNNLRKNWASPIYSKLAKRI